MGGSFVPVQRNWKWFEDNAAEPSIQLDDEITTPTLSTNANIIRLRVCIADTGGKKSTQTWGLEYSENQADWFSFGPAADWNYADGQAAQGDTIVGFKLTDTNELGEYFESGANPATVEASVGNEMDYAIQATSNVSAETTYYFRVVGSISGAIPLGSGESYPSLVTAAASTTTTSTTTTSSSTTSSSTSSTASTTSSSSSTSSTVSTKIGRAHV